MLHKARYKSPTLREEIDEVPKVLLTSRRTNNGLDGDAEERQREEENEDPEEGLEDRVHGVRIIQQW